MSSAVTSIALSALQTAIGADTVTFDGSVVGLVTTDFTPAPDTRMDELTIDQHGGMEPKEMNGSSLDGAIDPVTGKRKEFAPPPAGGWKFEIAADPGAPYQVFGWCWAPGTLSTAFKSFKFDTPVDITQAHDSIVIPEVSLDILPNGIQ